jgi:two-component system, NtrC family, response regulator
MANILIIDDDADFCISLQRVLQHEGHTCSFSLTLRKGIEEVRQNTFDLIFLDVALPDGNGLKELKSFKTAQGNPEIIILTGHGDPDGAGMAIKNGAWDYIEKPVSLNSIRLILKRALVFREKKTGLANSSTFDRSSIIGFGSKITACLEIVAKAANSHSNVIIAGETGTGKELFAKAIHENSSRRGSLIVIDCTNLPKTLAESLLFGHVKGSFTGAYDAQEGLFKQADGGTVFLDEVGEMSLALQKSLLRVLQEKKFRPIGAKKEVTSNFRVIAASNRDLKKMVDAGQFRSDLYFRLSGLRIDLPSLRERVEDLKDLGSFYIGRICNEYRIQKKGMSKDFLDALGNYQWPGNIRELINVLYASIDNAYDEPILYPHHLPIDLRVFIAKNSFLLKNSRPKQVEFKERHPSPPEQGHPPVVERAPAPQQGGHFQPFHPQVSTPVVANRRGELNHLECDRTDTASVRYWNILEEFESFPSIKEVREETVCRMESDYLRELSKLCRGKIHKACEISGLSRARLYELLKKHNVSIVR